MGVTKEFRVRFLRLVPLVVVWTIVGISGCSSVSQSGARSPPDEETPVVGAMSTESEMENSQEEEELDELDATLLRIKRERLQVIEDAATYGMYGVWIIVGVLFLFCVTMILRSVQLPKKRPFDPKRERRRRPKSDVYDSPQTKTRSRNNS